LRRDEAIFFLGLNTGRGGDAYGDPTYPGGVFHQGRKIYAQSDPFLAERHRDKAKGKF
jgi:hypothetical protein